MPQKIRYLGPHCDAPTIYSLPLFPHYYLLKNFPGLKVVLPHKTGVRGGLSSKKRRFADSIQSLEEVDSMREFVGKRLRFAQVKVVLNRRRAIYPRPQ